MDVDREDFKPNLCRLCLGFENVSVHIGQQTHESPISIAEKIYYCTTLEVKVGDSYHQSICTTCSESINFIYNFKSNAIACDLELSKNIHSDVNIIYSQISEDPLNIIYELKLEEDNSKNISSSELGISCVSSIIDCDTKIFELINTSVEKEKKTTVKFDTNESTFTKSIYNEHFENNKNVVDLTQSKENFPLNDEKSKSKKIKTKNQININTLSMIVKNGKVMYICGTCGFEAEFTVYLKEHKKCSLFDVASFKCSMCPLAFKTRGILKRHKLEQHDVIFSCEYCKKLFKTKLGLDRHIDYNHIVLPSEFKCVECNAYFYTMNEMEDHLATKHSTGQSNNLFSCSYCKRTFKTCTAKNKHIVLKHIVKFKCSICHMVLPTIKAYNKHVYSVHKIN